MPRAGPDGLLRGPYSASAGPRGERRGGGSVTARKTKAASRAADGRAPRTLTQRVALRSQLIGELMRFTRRFVVLKEHQALVLALWDLHTYCIGELDNTPYLSVTSPDPECGKSRLLEVRAQLVARPWLISTPSDAVLYRYIDRATPTVLWDEIDTIFNPKTARFHEPKRAILDSGHRRGLLVPRAGDFGRKVDHFNPFCPKALAGIGTLPDTVARPGATN